MNLFLHDNFFELLPKALEAISNLIIEPNPQDPLVANIAEMYIKARPEYIETAKDWTKRYGKSLEYFVIREGQFFFCYQASILLK